MSWTRSPSTKRDTEYPHLSGKHYSRTNWAARITARDDSVHVYEVQPQQESLLYSVGANKARQLRIVKGILVFQHREFGNRDSPLPIDSVPKNTRDVSKKRQASGVRGSLALGKRGLIRFPDQIDGIIVVAELADAFRQADPRVRLDGCKVERNRWYAS